MQAIVAPDVPRRPADSPTPGDRVFRAVVVGAASAALAVIGLTIAFLFQESRPALRSTGLKDFVVKSIWDVSGDEYGVFGLVIGTGIIAVIAMVIAVPMSIMMAVFINEYAPPVVARWLTTIVDLLAALPSILFALWARDVLPIKLQPVSRWMSEHLVALPFFRLSADDALLAGSSFNAGLVVSVMVMPIITAVTRDVMSQVPREQCEGALALGGTRWAMIREVIIPFARPGIIGASLLGFGRALGETIAVAYIIQLSYRANIHILEGDDERFEYIYRYVSAEPWKKMRREGRSPLDEGVLYVGKFNVDGTGVWLPLTPENPALTGWTLADIMIKTRQAADLAGATKMDRPEWIDTYPDQLMAIATLTNNSRRGTGTNPAVDASNPRSNNVYGHIIRWGYDVDFTGNGFWWDIFALAGDRTNPAHGATVNGDKYGSPDGIYVAPSGRLWIQTDVSTSTINAGAYAGFGHNQMLCADPTTRRTRRFLVGPKQCEVTGVFVTPDEKTMFVGIQHPGERPDDQPGNPANPKEFSSWPDGAAGGRPRSSLVVITKNDGGQVGS